LPAEAEPMLRRCFREPIPEIFAAAAMLKDAVSAHIAGDFAGCEALIHKANDPAVRAWTAPFLGSWRRNPFINPRQVAGAPPIIPRAARTTRMPNRLEKAALVETWGHGCAFCGIPLIRVEVRKALCAAYPAAAVWGATNDNCHAALLCMSLQYDHVVPHSRGGDNSLKNLVVTCAACNYGRMWFVLDEVGLMDPRDRLRARGDWTGLEEFLSR
jgi:hypothetical protein